MVVARPVLARVLPGQELALPGTPMIWTGPIRGHRDGSRPHKSPLAARGGPASIKPQGRAKSWGKADRACRLGGNTGSLRLFPQLVIDPAQGCGRMGKADSAGEQDDGVVDFFRGRPGL